MRLSFSILLLLIFSSKLSAQEDTATFRLATSYYMKEEYLEAEELYKQILAINPNNAKALDRIGWCINKGKLNQKTLDYFLEQSKQHPQNISMLLSIAMIELKMGKKQATFDHLSKALKIDSTNAEALYYMGSYYSDFDDPKNAEKYFLKALDNNDCPLFNADICLELGNIYYDQKKYEQSIRFMTKAIEADKNLFYAYLTRSICYEQLNKPDKGAEDFQMYKATKHKEGKTAQFICD